MEFLSTGLAVGGLGALLLVVGFLVAIALRRVVSTNEVHIVQSAKKTTSYGKDTGKGLLAKLMPAIEAKTETATVGDFTKTTKTAKTLNGSAKA